MLKPPAALMPGMAGGATAKAEFAHDAQFKLYASGAFYDVGKDDSEKTPLAFVAKPAPST